MKRLQVLIYSLIGLLFLTQISCEKENNVYPRVVIRYPLSGGNYDFRDTLRMGVEVVNGDGRVSVSLMDGARVISVAHQLVYQQGNLHEYELYFTDKNLKSGKYEIQVLAFNGENRGSDFSEIRYVELPLRLKGFMTLSGNGNIATVTSYDSIGNIKDIQLNGDYPYLAFNSYQQVGVAAPEVIGQLTAFSFINPAAVFSVSNPANQGLKQYEYLFSDDELNYALENNGRIRAYNSDGSIAKSFSLPNGYIPQKGKIDEPGFLVATQLDGTNSFQLFLLNPQNGSVQKQTNLPGKVVSIGYAGQSTFVLTYRKNGDAIIGTYNTVSNLLTEYGKISGAKPLSLLRISDNEFLISTENKILRFNPHSPQIPSLLYSFAAADMEYDELANQAYFASGKSVWVTNNWQTPYTVLTTNDSIRQIELVYNK